MRWNYVVAAVGLLVGACSNAGGEPEARASVATDSVTTAIDPTTPTAPGRASTTTGATPTTTAHREHCDHDGTPVGALPPATPMFCHTLATGVAPTFEQGANSWLDEFDHGASMAALGEGYLAFDDRVQFRAAGHFRHNDHWMVDIQTDGASGNVMMRPDRSFRFENGTLVVEADVAAGIDAYGPNVWTEIVVTTSPTPHPGPPPYPDEGYAYGQFRDAHTLGIRLQSSRFPITALFAPSGDRTWEHPHNIETPSVSVGGAPFGDLDHAWRTCDGTDPDTSCRDRFRLELSKDRLLLMVNGVRYLDVSGFRPADQLPDAFIDSPVYVYFASSVHTDGRETIRYHWDRIAVNPS